MQTEVKLLRKNGRGIAGTYENARCHANPMLPFIEALEEEMSKMEYATWTQGHNVHILTTEDGRKFVFRARRLMGEPYSGVYVSLRISRTLEYPILEITEVAQVPDLVSAMKTIAKPIGGNDYRDSNQD
jgi:hypothetical protein